MSGNLSGFDANQVEPNTAFTPLPAGEYDAIIVESEMKPTKDGTGKYLQLKLQILNGKFQNRTLFDRLNLVNKNDTAVQIAKGTLSAICRAVNVLTPNDSASCTASRCRSRLLFATTRTAIRRMKSRAISRDTLRRGRT
jgi:hypothetical protein